VILQNQNTVLNINELQWLDHGLYVSFEDAPQSGGFKISLFAKC
jgi:hypothetical protein